MMKILFVGQNPSKYNLYPGVPFMGSKSGDTVLEWLNSMNLSIYDCMFINAANKYGKISLKDVNTKQLFGLLEDSNISHKVACLGNYAEKAVLKSIKGKTISGIIETFKLPHPSPRNRALNDKEWVRQKLKECKEFLEK